MRMYVSLCESTRVCADLHESARVSANLREFEQIYANLRKSIYLSIPNIPNILTVSNIPIIIQISWSFRFQKCLTLGVCQCPDILIIPEIPESHHS